MFMTVTCDRQLSLGSDIASIRRILVPDTGHGTRLPQPRGELSAWLVDHLHSQGTGARPTVSGDDPLVGDDFHLALHLCYELSYQGLRGVPDRFERDAGVVALRNALEERFERALRDEWAIPEAATAGAGIDELLVTSNGPSLSGWFLAHGTPHHVREFAIHRSAYQLKEADPHTWGLPRLTRLRRSAFVEIQMDEYGEGRPGEAHAELFAHAMEALDLDATYGAYLDRLPGVTLATGNLISLLGMQRRLVPALLGHLAVFEMTSVEPMARYAATCERLGLPRAVKRFYDVHVEADEHHGRLAREVLIGGDTTADGLPPSEIIFGAAALMHVEDRLTRHLLDHWTEGRTSLR